MFVVLRTLSRSHESYKSVIRLNFAEISINNLMWLDLFPFDIKLQIS